MYNPDILYGNAPFKKCRNLAKYLYFFSLSLFVFFKNVKQSHGRHVNFGLAWWPKIAKQSKLGKKKFYKVLDHKHMWTRYMWPLLCGPLVL